MIDESSLHTCADLREELKDRARSALWKDYNLKVTNLSKNFSETHQLRFKRLDQLDPEESLRARAYLYRDIVLHESEDWRISSCKIFETFD